MTGSEVENPDDIQEEREMKVQNHITIFTGDTQENIQTDKAGAKKTAPDSAVQKNRTFYAGNMLKESPLRDRIQQRKTQAQERAMKLVEDAWNGDRMFDAEIGRCKEKQEDLWEDIQYVHEDIKWLTGKRDSLAESYGVTPDSQEQRDLDLLMKKQSEMTPEEKERYAEIITREPTEYQERWMELDNLIGDFRDVIEDLNFKIVIQDKIIHGIRTEKNKSHKMSDAQAQAEDVVEDAQKEVIGMVTAEAKDHIDEGQEEREDEAEAIKEKKEEQEEVLEERKERDEELADLMKDMPVKESMKADDIQAQIRKEIQDIVNKMNLVVEDIKGAQVDEVL